MNDARDVEDNRLLEAGERKRLVANYFHRVHELCFLRLRDRDAADEAAQIVLLRLFSELERGKQYSVPFRVVVWKVVEWTVRGFYPGAKQDATLPEDWDPATVGENEAVEDDYDFGLLIADLPRRQHQVVGQPSIASEHERDRCEPEEPHSGSSSVSPPANTIAPSAMTSTDQPSIRRSTRPWQARRDGGARVWRARSQKHVREHAVRAGGVLLAMKPTTAARTAPNTASTAISPSVDVAGRGSARATRQTRDQSGSDTPSRTPDVGARRRPWRQRRGSTLHPQMQMTPRSSATARPSPQRG